MSYDRNLKPKWEHAPAWAKYVAQDPDGSWYWYEETPIPGIAGKWTNQQRTKYEEAFAMGEVEARPNAVNRHVEGSK
jgi:hypothetical protein